MVDNDLITVKGQWVRGKSGVWTIRVICPFCGKHHSHGGGDGDTPYAGHRASDCASTGGYMLPEYVQDQTQERD